MNNEINHINNYKRSLITFLTIPLILIGCIYICYGEVFDGIKLQQTNPIKFHQLHVQLAIFSGDFSQVPLRLLPKVTASIGYYSVITIYILFSGWLILFTISSYLKLSQRVGSKIIILVETVLILAIYIISISPDLNLWLSLVGYLIISVVLLMQLLYWVYAIKIKQ
ncbi:MAG: hypothetical protein K8S18_13880 [Desulfobacula sp.]|nr:hypothetical protein [Desulfobacula sp.]